MTDTITKNQRLKWAYLEKEPATDAPFSDNPSGMYCPNCRASGLGHCSWPEYCGGMKLMRPNDQPKGATHT